LIGNPAIDIFPWDWARWECRSIVYCKKLTTVRGEIDRLNRAFGLTLSALHLVDRNDPVCAIVARKVIEIDAAGWHEPGEIAKLAAEQLG
jgi:hypothetical protein